jgi:hypothetical protein
LIRKERTVPVVFPVAVTEVVYDPTVISVLLIFSVEVAEPPDERAIMLELKDTKGPSGQNSMNHSS